MEDFGENEYNFMNSWLVDRQHLDSCHFKLSSYTLTIGTTRYLHSKIMILFICMYMYWSVICDTRER